MSWPISILKLLVESSRVTAIVSHLTGTHLVTDRNDQRTFTHVYKDVYPKCLKLDVVLLKKRGLIVFANCDFAYFLSSNHFGRSYHIKQ